jgi:uncharacterized Zn-finger protein
MQGKGDDGQLMDTSNYCGNGSVDEFIIEDMVMTEITEGNEEYDIPQFPRSVNGTATCENQCDVDVSETTNVEDRKMSVDVLLANKGNQKLTNTELENDEDEISLGTKATTMEDNRSNFVNGIGNLRRNVSGSDKESTRFQCHCGKTFSHKTNLTTHKKTHNANFAASLCCSDCGKKFSSKVGLNRHVKTTHQGYFYECPVCKKKQTQAGHLMRHIKKEHPGSNARPVEKFDKTDNEYPFIG